MAGSAWQQNLTKKMTRGAVSMQAGERVEAIKLTLNCGDAFS
eukprot:CAMPEP_0180808324 /NCGR_PEP_ID=MMETSP1038_2-20121128/63736_1 /TAXON_ID=632150 /ORGANISM="Azadinium spinosum, Strain 3D9" /LENGTH=41 /DNA_ID= /DNA_START= /DNA_END= /DNA_ORIENTATION=